MISDDLQSSEECFELNYGGDYILAATTVTSTSLRTEATTHYFHEIMFLNYTEEPLRLCDSHSE